MLKRIWLTICKFMMALTSALRHEMDRWSEQKHPNSDVYMGDPDYLALTWMIHWHKKWSARYLNELFKDEPWYTKIEP